MRIFFANYARLFIVLGAIYALMLSNITLAAERSLCGSVSKADVSDSGDLLIFSVKQGKKQEEFSIYIEDEVMKFSDLIWESSEKNSEIYISLNDGKITKIANKCSYADVPNEPNEPNEPNKGFFSGTFASASPMGNVVVADDASPIFDFFKKRPVEWEKLNDDQWIARIKNTDPLTGKYNETAILLVREMSSGKKINSKFLLMSRVVHNGKEVPASEVNSLAMQMYITERPPGMP